MERRDGILQITFHTDGDTLQWGERPHRESPSDYTLDRNLVSEVHDLLTQRILPRQTTVVSAGDVIQALTA